MPKEMKKQATKTDMAKNINAIHKGLFTKVLQKVKGLTLTQNARGAVQVKREGNNLLFSARTDGKMIITHPIFTKVKGKNVRFCKHSGNAWDHLSNVPFDQVTEKMLMDRCADKKNASDYHAQFYGKNQEASGLVQKAQRARDRVAKAKAEATKATKSAKGAKREATKATTKAKVAKASTPKRKSAIVKVKAEKVPA